MVRDFNVSIHLRRCKGLEKMLERTVLGMFFRNNRAMGEEPENLCQGQIVDMYDLCGETDWPLIFTNLRVLRVVFHLEGHVEVPVADRVAGSILQGGSLGWSMRSSALKPRISKSW